MSSGVSAPQVGALVAVLLELHERSHELPYRAFQHFALERMRSLVPFEAGVLAIGTMQHGAPEPHDVYLHDLPPEFLSSWTEVRHDDQVIIAAFGAPGHTLRIDIERDDVYRGREAMASHSRTWGIAHVLCTTHVDEGSGLYWVQALSHSTHAFTEDERRTVELAAPHLVASARHARLGQLRTTPVKGESRWEASALVNRAGLILEAGPGFVELLRRDHPRWTGPWLPSTTPFTGKRIVLRFDDVQDGVLVHVRGAVAADSLTERQREIAEAFSLGDSYREIAERLGVAPNTVRTHLANVYEKLGISSKAELDRMIRGTQ